MGYEDQLRQMERIVDKMNVARSPDGDAQKRLKELEEAMEVFGALCLIQLVAVVILVIAHLGV